MNNRGKYPGNTGHVPDMLRDKAYLSDLYVSQELSSRDIAKAHGVSKPTILRFLNLAGIQVRRGRAAWDTKGYRRKMSGPNHPNFKDGKRSIISGWGYKNIVLYGDDRAGHRCNSQGRVPEHVYVFENAIGRSLTPEEVVHHVNFTRLDNRLENLILFPSQAEHTRYHKYLERVGAWSLGMLPEKPEYHFQPGTVIGTQT